MTRSTATAWALAATCALAGGCRGPSGDGGGTRGEDSPPRHSPFATDLDAAPGELAPDKPRAPNATGGKIAHVVVIVQEGRSFDHYFGTFPGVDGLPRDAKGTFTTCLPDKTAKDGCVKPFHDTSDVDVGADHGKMEAVEDSDNGKMDGFAQVQSAARDPASKCKSPTDPACSSEEAALARHDVMGFHTDAELPLYWGLAREYALCDDLFASTHGASSTEHVFLVSGWSAECPSPDPMTCIGGAESRRRERRYAWADLTWLLRGYDVSWKYYVHEGTDPTCERAGDACAYEPQEPTFPTSVNPMPRFDTVRQQGPLTSHLVSTARFLSDAKAGALPAVSWVVPSDEVSEAAPASVRAGQAYVAELLRAVMGGPSWKDTLVIVTWSGWGGFYDHVAPPKIDADGYGFRVPAIVVGPYVKRGYVEHARLSHDSILRLVEDVFMGGQRLDPKTDGRPDPRPTLRDEVAGDLRSVLDLKQPPRAPTMPPAPPAP